MKNFPGVEFVINILHIFTEKLINQLKIMFVMANTTASTTKAKKSTNPRLRPELSAAQKKKINNLREKGMSMAKIQDAIKSTAAGKSVSYYDIWKVLHP